MSSPARAFAVQFQRHLTPLPFYFLYLVIAGFALPSMIGDRQVRFGDEIAAMAMVPFSFLFFYLLASFTFGLTGDISARRSMYPTRMFTLPITNAALAGWPMFYGVITMMLLIVTTTWISRAVWGMELPLWWPALLGAVVVAWAQAFTWMPYGLENVRVVFTVAWLVILDAIVIVAIEFKLSEARMVAFLAPQLPLAYLAAVWAVARARRGDTPEWRLLASIRKRGSRHRAFAGPASAQRWLEWRRGGRSLPTMVTFVLPFIAWLLFIPGNDTAAVVFLTLGAMLLTPPVMAGFAAGAGSRPNPNASDPLALSTLDAIRPVTTAALIAAKLKATLISTLAAWTVVAIVVPLALVTSGTWPVVSERWRALADIVGDARATVSTVLVLVLLIASTWKKLVQRLYIGLTGRTWIIKTSGYVAVFAVIAILPVLGFVRRDADAQTWLWENWRVLAAVLVAAKTLSAGWIALRLYQTRLVSDNVLMVGAALWVAVVMALYGVLVWMFYTPYVPRHTLLLIAILAVPLTRIAAAPLALNWNRHQ